MTPVATISLHVYLITLSPQGVQRWIFPSDGLPSSYQPRSPGLNFGDNLTTSKLESDYL